MKRVVLVTVRALAALLVLALGFGAAWLMARGVYTFLTSAPKEVSGAVIAAIGVILGGTVVAVYQRRGAVEEGLRTARTPMYEEFMEFFFERLFVQASDADKPDDQELQKFFTGFTRKSIVLSSDRFVREWSRYRRRLVGKALQTTNINAPNHLLIEFEKVLLEIRRDFGHSNRGLKVGDVLGMWVNDVPITSRSHRRT